MTRRNLDSNNEGEENVEVSNVIPVTLSFVLSPLGQVLVQPSDQFPNLTESITSSNTKPPPDKFRLLDSNGIERLTIPTIPSLAQISTFQSHLPIDTHLGFSSEKGVLKRPTIATYYPDWNLDVLAPEQIDYSKYDLIAFAFAIPTEDFSIKFTQDDSIQTLDKLVKYAHGNHTLVCLSIGGWDGSKYFSSAVKTASNRETFANNIIKIAHQHKVDGIDIDWEYPAQAGIADNTVDDNDSTAMLLFFHLLRDKLGPSMILSAAVTDYTFLDNHGHRMVDVKAYAEVLDHILIMNYDYDDVSETPGPNSPFSNACGDASQPSGNMVSAINAWTDAGFPADKILMGLPAYGYIHYASITKMIHRRHNEISPRTRFQQYTAQSNHQLHRRQNACTVSSVNCQIDSFLENQKDDEIDSLGKAGNLKDYSGPQITFHDLFKWGVLAKNITNSKIEIMAINGYKLGWDTCSSTPYAFNEATQTVVNFDDTRSIAIKSAYALKVGIGGVGFWDLTGDPHSVLTNVARAILKKT
ncbi:family 18 glycoside hydrolase [Melampsora larici-populina 98AG31]|uniref:Family 18 glycoside hydrolase n=1 Tax=Melampsora larici-populina (strain 98AG31 / pathotype 3-4-7) TaxID=747676 RepID=F4RMI0_MELLP|nr:family 18 glycoside hydrolase [Melampsora larici-populina 98AG31]EGG06430.1 family 18 glycoside hydrolase [Melampsora larici-populina 98AG31]